MRGREGQPGRVERGTGITPAYAGKSRPAVIIAGHFRDHPRVCGEERKRKKLTGWQRGSPPRMRGREYSRAPTYHPYGITPAYAGKSYEDGALFPLSKDHPRVCGEKPSLFLMGCIELGSPPRMRGKDLFCHVVPLHGGITPAYAGKSGAPVGRLAVVRDHPRVCGEKCFPVLGKPQALGSPPRMRGKVSRLYALADKEGITPAYAGKRGRSAHP